MLLIKEAIETYTDPMSFVKLVWRRLQLFNQKFGTSFHYNDAELRGVARNWSDAMDQYKHFIDGDFHLLINEMFSDLLVILYGRISACIVSKNVSNLIEKNEFNRRIIDYFGEYMSYDIVISIIIECLGEFIERPSPEKFLEASVNLRSNKNIKKNKLLGAIGLPDMSSLGL